MSLSANVEVEVLEEARVNFDSLMTRMLLDYHVGTESAALNARSVEFIAKPGRVQHLRNCMRQEIPELLKQQIGFAGMLVLTSHKEPRLVQVLSFWDTAGQSSGNHWEDLPAVRRLVSTLIDVCGKVHSYEAAMPESLETILQTSSVPTC